MNSTASIVWRSAEARERVVQAIDHQGAVGEAGQVVVQRHVAEPMGLRGAVDGECDEVAGALDDGALCCGRGPVVAEVDVEQRDEALVVGAHARTDQTVRSPCLRASSRQRGGVNGRELVDHDGPDAA